MQCYVQQPKRKDKTGMYTYTCNKTDDENNEERES